MNNDIKGVRGTPAVRPTLTAVNGPPVTRSPPGAGRTSSSGDQVTLSGLGAQIQAITEALERVPVVDLARVSSVREAVVTGGYEIDAWAVADKVIQIERMLPELPDADAA